MLQTYKVKPASFGLPAVPFSPLNPYSSGSSGYWLSLGQLYLDLTRQHHPLPRAFLPLISVQLPAQKVLPVLGQVMMAIYALFLEDKPFREYFHSEFPIHFRTLLGGFGTGNPASLGSSLLLVQMIKAHKWKPFQASCQDNLTTLCKNIVLAGIGSLTLMDDSPVTWEASLSNFLIPGEEAVNEGKSIAEVCQHSLRDFNPMVKLMCCRWDLKVANIMWNLKIHKHTAREELDHNPRVRIASIESNQG
eukprot:Gb_18555 [translate_table: standard]